MAIRTTLGMDNRTAIRAVRALKEKVGHPEAARLLAVSGMAPALIDKLCGERYDSDLRKKSARALLAALKKAQVDVAVDEAS